MTLLMNNDSTNGESNEVLLRMQQGASIAAKGLIRRVGDDWLVPSDTGGSYHLCTLSSCQCQDFTSRGLPCKHIFAVRLVTVLDDDIGENIITNTVPEPPAVPEIPEPSPSQRRKAYDAAQESETRNFIRLAWDLVKTIPEPPYHGGRPVCDVHKVLYGLLIKGFFAKSGRRAYSDLDIAAEIIGLNDLPSRSSLTRYMGYESITPILLYLVETCAVPLSPIETRFAIDSTGFASDIQSETWAQHVWGSEEDNESSTGTIWTKAHICIGVRTNIITAAYVTHSLRDSGDAPQLPVLLHITGRHFAITSVYADGAYLSEENILSTIELGATLYTPFSPTSIYHTPYTKLGRCWNESLAFFRDHQDQFLREYHLRSDVEAAIGSTKGLFGSVTRCKTPVARVNETLVKLVCENVTRVIHAMFLYDVRPTFTD